MMIAMAPEDHLSLRTITPVALAHYAQSEGWYKVGTYRDFSDVYAGDGRPEIVVPRTDTIGDYEIAVSDLIKVFTSALARDDVTIYRDLTLADRDVLRIRALEASSDGLPFEDSHILLSRTRRMLVAAARSLTDNRRVFRTRANNEVISYLRRMQLGHTESGSFSLIIVSPTIAPSLRPDIIDTDQDHPAIPMERRVGVRLSESLTSTREATERVSGGDTDAFEERAMLGVSANLCESVADLVDRVSPFDVSFSWARTRPSSAKRGPVEFSHGDVPILREVALNFRSLEPEYDRTISGFVYRLTQHKEQAEGTISMQTNVEGTSRSVVAVLNQRDYRIATEAHMSKDFVYLKGDLERGSGQLRLLDAQIVDIVRAPTLFDVPESSDASN